MTDKNRIRVGSRDSALAVVQSKMAIAAMQNVCPETEFELIMRAIGNPSSDSVMDDIIHYIEHNYMDNIKLENIAPLFGYNSSYLGKIFNKKVGEGFNVFIDKVRINHSKDLLINTELKVYEIAEKVGYRNVDYFHTKFKKYVKESPAEFRKKNK